MDCVSICFTSSSISTFPLAGFLNSFSICITLLSVSTFPLALWILRLFFNLFHFIISINLSTCWILVLSLILCQVINIEPSIYWILGLCLNLYQVMNIDLYTCWILRLVFQSVSLHQYRPFHFLDS